MEEKKAKIKKQKETKMQKWLSKLGKTKPSKKSLFKKQKLGVELNIPKGTRLLAQKSAFFNEGFEKEKPILSWD